MGVWNIEGRFRSFQKVGINLILWITAEIKDVSTLNVLLILRLELLVRRGGTDSSLFTSSSSILEEYLHAHTCLSYNLITFKDNLRRRMQQVTINVCFNSFWYGTIFGVLTAVSKLSQTDIILTHLIWQYCGLCLDFIKTWHQ